MPMLDTEPDEVERVFEVNVFAVLKTVKAFAPLLVSAKGRIVNISSIAQVVPVPYMGIYCMSKAALGMMSDTLRIEMKPFGVTVVHVRELPRFHILNDSNGYRS
jgi:1-acylglycerone phosphate reductase